MDKLNENKFIKNNIKISLFDYISEELKEEIDKRRISEKLNLYFRKLYNKENENYDKMIIHINYIKDIEANIDYNFCIIIEENFPMKPPKIYCQSSDINSINLNDRRDLLYSIIEKKWVNENINRIDILANIILKKIPEFISRLLFYEENHILLYYGVYTLNEIYNMNSFLMNNKLYFFKVMTFNKDNSKFSESGIKYIIVTDIYILFFDLIEDKPKNLGKLIFIGEILQYNCIERLNVDINDNIFNEDNIEESKDHICIDKNKVYIDWVIQDKNYSFIFSLIKEKKDNDKNNNSDSKNIDFINLINQKQNFIRNKYKLYFKDYNQMESMTPLIESPNEFNENKLKNLFELEKYFETLKKKKSSQKNQNLKNEKDNIFINNEIYKIYQKIIEVTTKNNKIEITFDYLDKIERKNKMEKKIIYNDGFKNVNYNDNNNDKIKENHHNNNYFNKEEDNIKDIKNKEKNIKNENINKVKELNVINNKSSNEANNKYKNKNSVFNLINKINNNIKDERISIKNIKKENNDIPKPKKEINSILSLVQKFEKK